MKTLALGSTGAQVSALCLGTMLFGTSTDEKTSYRLLDQYADAGGRFLDTANIYSRWIPGFAGGESESLLGRWMKERGNRSSLVLASKVGFEMPGVERGLKARQIEAECDKSLKRLGVSTIDLYYAHVDDRSTPVEETMEALGRLVKAGKVRWLGASNFLAWRLEEARSASRARQLPEYVCIQQRHSYLAPAPGADFGAQIASNADLLDYCRARGTTLLAYSPLLGGAYTRADKPLPAAYRDEYNQRRLQALGDVAREKGVTANQVVLAWMLQSDPVALPLVAASDSRQLAENLGALDVTLSPAELERLKL
jgi:aryl-alcohol dehydrogenase-like predicted oxidoreductase